MINDAPRQFDVIVTAGDRGTSRPVFQKNKVFLTIEDIPVINYVLSAVERTRCAARIVVVGDKVRLEDALAVPHNPFQGLCPILLIEQGNTLYDNVWNGFLHTLPGYTPGADWRPYQATAEDKAVLVISGDIPLATPAEIDAFVESCDLTRYDYFLGLTAEPDLRPYYPQDGHLGIRMAYFGLREMQVRQNNLHLVKPFRIGNRHYIQRIYDARYQKEWRNIFNICWQLALCGGIASRVLWAFLCLHAARTITRFGWQSARPLQPFFLDLSRVASLVSQLLRTRFSTAFTHYGGCTLDVDNEEHYEAICANFNRWREHQEALAENLKQQT
jgi:GTP:adenosylcobinamide-phosphate guanylyltransferase